MVPTPIPLYYESSWSILSTIGLVNLLYGLLIIGITGFTPIVLVPITVSVATAIANGLCYYALYETHSQNATLLGSVFAEVFWLIQEAGLSFYSYLILIRILRGRPRYIFLSLFWFFIVCIIALRFSITGCRAQNLIHPSDDLETLIGRLHIGYFVSIALIEILSAFFLIRIFSRAKKDSAEISARGGLFHYLAQSTELRLATLALIGITRAITYSFQKSVKASNVTGQIDRFVFTLECVFPMMMYIDILASRVRVSTHSHHSSSPYHDGSNPFRQQRPARAIDMYPLSHEGSPIGSTNQFSQSQERIVDGAANDDIRVLKMGDGDGETKRIENMGGAIHKTVDFKVREYTV